jgi:hypothetical protein
MKVRTTISLLVSAVLASACAGDAAHDPDDHPEGALQLEGEALAAFLPGGVSAPVPVADGFRRVGLLWDAADADALELRTSRDGTTWSAWRAPLVVSAEDIAHAGHVDADGDRDAAWLQVRVAAGKAAPTFLVIEPMPDVPPAFDPAEAVAVEEETEGGALWWDEQPTPIGTLRVYSRADWGARAPRCASSSMNPVRATIHHTATPTNDSLSPEARLRQIQAFHQDSRGWCDIGYNYLVSRDGRVWRARGPTTVGAHVANANTGNIGISIIGTHTTTPVTGTQMCNTAKLLRRLREAYGISLARSNVRGHRQYGGTTCPGNALYAQIDAILRKATSGCQVN